MIVQSGTACRAPYRRMLQCVLIAGMIAIGPPMSTNPRPVCGTPVVERKGPLRDLVLFSHPIDWAADGARAAPRGVPCSGCDACNPYGELAAPYVTRSARVRPTRLTLFVLRYLHPT